MRQRKHYLIAMILALAFVWPLTGCMTTGGNIIAETPKGKYVQARKFYNDQLEALVAYGPLMTPEEKGEMKKELDPVLDSIETVLDGWKLAFLDPAENPESYNLQWRKLRAQFVAVIRKFSD